MPTRIVQSNNYTESHENPFMADGELSKKADYIISHSTISRTELKIEDPDQEKKRAIEEGLIRPADAPSVQSAPPSDRPNDIGVKNQNGKLEEPIAPSSVEVVETANATQPEPEQAEEVKVKDSKKLAAIRDQGTKHTWRQLGAGLQLSHNAPGQQRTEDERVADKIMKKSRKDGV